MSAALLLANPDGAAGFALWRGWEVLRDGAREQHLSVSIPRGSLMDPFIS